MGILKKHFPAPSNIPSRVFRNVPELTGQIIRSQIERKEIFEKLLKGQDTTNYSKLFMWFHVRKLLPNRLRKALRKAKQIKAPLIKKVQLKMGR